MKACAIYRKVKSAKSVMLHSEVAFTLLPFMFTLTP